MQKRELRCLVMYRSFAPAMRIYTAYRWALSVVLLRRVVLVEFYATAARKSSGLGKGDCFWGLWRFGGLNTVFQGC